MTDARMPDRWLTSKRLMTLPDGAFKLYVVGLMMAVSNRSDGQLDEDDFRMMLCDSGPANRAVLIKRGLWAVDGGGWSITEFQTTQTSAAQLAAYEAKSADDRDRKSRSRARQKLRAEGVSPDGHGTKGRDVCAPTQDRTDKATTGHEVGEVEMTTDERSTDDGDDTPAPRQDALRSLHGERYSGSDADPMSAPYLAQLDEEDREWGERWGRPRAS